MLLESCFEGIEILKVLIGWLGLHIWNFMIDGVVVGVHNIRSLVGIFSICLLGHWLLCVIVLLQLGSYIIIVWIVFLVNVWSPSTESSRLLTWKILVGREIIAYFILRLIDIISVWNIIVLNLHLLILLFLIIIKRLSKK